MSTFDGIFIGHGIASYTVLYYFSKIIAQKNGASQKILVLESPQSLPCSLNTTSHAGTINSREGISPLGDMIKDAYFSFCDFVDEDRPKGVYEGRLFKSYDISDEVRPELTKQIIPFHFFKNKSFYGCWDKHHIIEPYDFMNWMKEQYLLNFEKNGIEVVYKKEHVENVFRENQNYVLKCSEESYQTKSLFLGTGPLKLDFWNQDHWNYTKMKQRGGDYLFKKGINLGEESFAVTVENASLVYRHFNQEVLIGGTTNPEGFQEINHKELREYHSLFKDYHNELPCYRQFELGHGMRMRGVKRMPFSGEIAPKLYALLGLYKNGFTFPFLLAPELAKKMLVGGFLS